MRRPGRRRVQGALGPGAPVRPVSGPQQRAADRYARSSVAIVAHVQGCCAAGGHEPTLQASSRAAADFQLCFLT